MTSSRIDRSTSRQALRLRPGIVAVMLQWLAWAGVPLVASGPTAGYVMVLGALLGGVAVVVWWAFFSRAPRSERWGAVALMIVALVATSRLLHESLATGMMGLIFPLYAVPVLSLAFVAWAVAGRSLADGPRRATMVATILLACGLWTLVRSDGITGEGSAQFAWRWAETAEERLLSRGDEEPAPPPPPAAVRETPREPVVSPTDKEPVVPPPAPETATVETPEPPAERVGDRPEGRPSTAAAGETAPDWPGFRGPARDGVVPGVRIETDWAASPPVELWRRPIGPGWSSFAAHGDLLYTQEQRGEDEVVTCYRVASGEPVWRHRDRARFWESNAGAGPRATPTLSEGRVYTFGATGILNALDAADGGVMWSRNAASDTGTKVPGWGFSSSPLVVDDAVVVAAAGALATYDAATGDPRWVGTVGDNSYSSPHLVTIDGVAQILLLTSTGATSVAPADGTRLWEHPWPANTRIVQPAVNTEGDILISAGGGTGLRRLAVARGSGGWTIEERWTSVRLKPYFNDFVVHEGHAFGFDGAILACIDLEDGERRWKGGRYGHGQLVLLPEQDLLLVLTETGEVALVAAVPDQFTEVARRPAIEGKTWNHPALVGDVLLARNGHEMVALRLPLAGG